MLSNNLSTFFGIFNNLNLILSHVLLQRVMYSQRRTLKVWKMNRIFMPSDSRKWRILGELILNN